MCLCVRSKGEADGVLQAILATPQLRPLTSGVRPDPLEGLGPVGTCPFTTSDTSDDIISSLDLPLPRQKLVLQGCKRSLCCLIVRGGGQAIRLRVNLLFGMMYLIGLCLVSCFVRVGFQPRVLGGQVGVLQFIGSGAMLSFAWGLGARLGESFHELVERHEICMRADRVPRFVEEEGQDCDLCCLVPSHFVLELAPLNEERRSKWLFKASTLSAEDMEAACRSSWAFGRKGANIASMGRSFAYMNANTKVLPSHRNDRAVFSKKSRFRHTCLHHSGSSPSWWGSPGTVNWPSSSMCCFDGGVGAVLAFRRSSFVSRWDAPPDARSCAKALKPGSVKRQAESRRRGP